MTFHQSDQFLRDPIKSYQVSPTYSQHPLYAYYVYVNTGVHVRIYVYACVYVCTIYACTNTCMYTCMHVCIHTSSVGGFWGQISHLGHIWDKSKCGYSIPYLKFTFSNVKFNNPSMKHKMSNLASHLAVYITTSFQHIWSGSKVTFRFTFEPSHQSTFLTYVGHQIWTLVFPYVDFDICHM